MMQRNIVLITLLMSSVCALPREMYKEDFPGDELTENSVAVIVKPGHRLPGMCWACKWAVGKVKQHIGTQTSKNVVRSLLNHICDEIGFLRFLCKSLVRRYMDVLVEELSTTDNPATICSHIRVC